MRGFRSLEKCRLPSGTLNLMGEAKFTHVHTGDRRQDKQIMRCSVTWHEDSGLWSEDAGGPERSGWAFPEDGARLAGASRDREGMKLWKGEGNLTRRLSVPETSVGRG